MREIRLGDELWESAPHSRRLEWRTLIADILDAEEIAPHAERMRVELRGEDLRFVLELEREDGELRAEAHVIPNALVAPHLAEYVTVIKKMIEPDIPAPRLEALDMAKKVVHDKAARALAEHAPALAGDHEGFRRLFSLIVALRVDTTNLPFALRLHPRPERPT